MKMKKTVSLFLSFIILIIILWSNVFAETDDNKHECGLIYEKTDFKTIEAAFKNNLLKLSDIPSSFDLTDKMPAVMLQKGSDCTACATGYALNSHLQNDDFNWGLTGNNHLFSPNYLYNQACNYAGGGTSFYDICNLLVNQGCCTLDKWAYTADYTVHPTASQIENAGNFKSSEWLQSSEYGTEGTINLIKEYIATNEDPVLIGIPVSKDFDTLDANNPIYDIYDDDTCRGGHAICLIGYDDSKGAFKLQNSWDTDWGINGYGWISYDLMKNSDFNLYDPINGHYGFPGYAYVVSDIRTADQNKITYVSSKVLSTGAGSQLTNKFSVNGIYITEGNFINSINRNYKIEIKEDDNSIDDNATRIGVLSNGMNTIRVSVYENPYNKKYSEIEFKIFVGSPSPNPINVKLTDIKVIKNTGIGINWKHSCKVGNLTLTKGKTVKTTAKALYLKSIEDDPVYDDVTIRTTSLSAYRDLKVWENKYNGKYAIVRYYFSY